MNSIIAQTEADPFYRETIKAPQSLPRAEIADAIGLAMRNVADLLDVAATVAYTSSGHSALRMARERPKAPIIGMTPKLATARSLALVWGVHAVLTHDVGLGVGNDRIRLRDGDQGRAGAVRAPS